MEIKLKKTSLSLFGKTIHYDEIQFKFGDYVLISGENGSGKSTLLKNIYNGKFIETNLSLEKDFIYIPQDSSYLDKSLRVIDWILYLNRVIFLNMLNKIFIDTNLIDLLGFKSVLELNKFKHKKLHMLSGGEQKILDLIIYLSMRKAVYLIDEPFNHISLANVKKVVNLINSAHMNSNCIIIIVSHFDFFFLGNKFYAYQEGKFKATNIKSYMNCFGELDNKGFFII